MEKILSGWGKALRTTTSCAGPQTPEEGTTVSTLCLIPPAVPPFTLGTVMGCGGGVPPCCSLVTLLPVEWFIFQFTNKHCEEAVILLSSQSSGELLHLPPGAIFSRTSATPTTYSLSGFSKSRHLCLVESECYPYPSCHTSSSCLTWSHCPLLLGILCSPSDGCCSSPLNTLQFAMFFSEITCALLDPAF